jgi:Fur family ferric uptake transcriptional regulator
MTVAPESRTIDAASIPAAVAALRANGLRVSTARRLVLEALFAAGGPATAEQLAAGLEGRLPESDVASMYRNLETLEQLGLVRHVHLGHGPGRYVLSGDAEAGYVTCERCGTFAPLDRRTLAAVRALVAVQTGFEPRFTHFPIVGRCASCAAVTVQEEQDHADR